MALNRASPAVRFPPVRGGGAFRPWPSRPRNAGSNSPETMPGLNTSAEVGQRKRVLGTKQRPPIFTRFPAFPTFTIQNARQSSMMPGRDSKRGCDPVAAIPSGRPTRPHKSPGTPNLSPGSTGKSQHDASIEYRSCFRWSAIVSPSDGLLRLTTYGVLEPPSADGPEHRLKTRPGPLRGVRPRCSVPPQLGGTASARHDCPCFRSDFCCDELCLFFGSIQSKMRIHKAMCAYE